MSSSFCSKPSNIVVNGTVSTYIDISLNSLPELKMWISVGKEQIVLLGRVSVIV